MRIMATSDLHGNLEGLDPKGADVVVLAGDIASLHGQGMWPPRGWQKKHQCNKFGYPSMQNRQGVSYINNQMEWINKRFREWTSSYPDIQFVVIPGNHDFYPIAHINLAFNYRSRLHDVWRKHTKGNEFHFLGADAIVKIYGRTFVDWFTRELQLKREADKRDKSRKEDK